MLRYAISNGQSALGPPPLPHNPCHSGRSEEPPYFVPSSKPISARLLAHAQSIADQRIAFFLLREPTLAAGQLATLAREMLTLFAGTPTRLLLHSRPDIAIAAGAHGVHLPSGHDSLAPAQVRILYAQAGLRNPVVTLSCHTEADLHRAIELQPDLLLFGPVFGKVVDGRTIHPGVGVEPLRAACRIAAPLPVLALGGVTEGNAPACLEAGAAGIAGIRLFQP